MNKKVWIIGVDAETGRYTPTYCYLTEMKMWTSEKGYATYASCLLVCQKLNMKEGKY